MRLRAHQLVRVLIAAVAALGCSAPAVQPSAPTAGPENTAEPAATAPTPAGPPSLRVSAAPTGNAASDIYDGRVLIAEGEEPYCAVTYSDGKNQLFEVELGGCSYREDEVSVGYAAGGSPSRDEAESELGERLEGCLEEPRFLPMATWPGGPSKVVVEDWGMKAALDGRTLSITVSSDEAPDMTARFELPAGHRVESIHHDGNFLLVVRSAGSKGGSPETQCHVGNLTDG